MGKRKREEVRVIPMWNHLFSFIFASCNESEKDFKRYNICTTHLILDVGNIWLDKRHLPVLMSWLTPSTDTVALLRGFPSLSLTTPLIPRFTCKIPI